MPQVIVTIESPPHLSDVPGGGSFTTFGFVSPPPEEGTTLAASCDEQDGEPVEPPPHDPPYHWAFELDGVTVGEFRDLVVEGTNGGDMGQDTHSIRCVE